MSLQFYWQLKTHITGIKKWAVSAHSFLLVLW